MTSDKTVLFVTPSQDSTVFGIKAGLEKVLSRHGMRLQLVYTPFERRISDMKVLVDLWHPVGVVAAISDFDVRNLRVPVVFAVAGTEVVGVDDAYGLRSGFFHDGWRLE